jgi:ABC-2 type transport system ATP-binding protein
MAVGPALETRGLSVTLGRTRALDDVSLTLKDSGRIVGLFGANGAGKTTLMRAVAGLINDYQGTVDFQGTVAFLPDSPFLYDFLTVRDCLRLCADVFVDFDRDVTAELLTQLGLRTDQRLGECSRGMSEQVHLAVVLGRRCRLYLLEPLAAVDPVTRDALIDMVRAYRPSEATVVISTHLIGGLGGLFDEMVVIDSGRVILQSDRGSWDPGDQDLERVFKEVIREHRLARRGP